MITSTSNQEIKDISKLQKSSKLRKEKLAFLVEGIRMFREIPEKNLIKAYVTESFYSNNQGLFEDKNYELVSDNVYNYISDTKSPQGVLALVKQFNYTIDNILKNDNPLLIVLENIQDPGNLGTIIRTAEGAGVDGIIMSSDTVDIYNSKVVRSTMGSVFRVPFYYSQDILETVDMLKNKNINVYAAHLKGESFYNEDYKKGTAFLVGNEGNGLSDAISHRANHLIKIKMQGRVESLNAATATTVLIYEAMRQRIMI